MTKFFIPLLALFVAVSCGQQPEAQVASIPDARDAKSETVEVVEHYPNGVLKISGTSVDGKRDGLWESFYENGYKWSEVEYKMGAKHGDIVVFYKNGMMRYQGRYDDDDRAGIWTFYDTLGISVKRVDMDEVRMNPDTLINP
jgi:hypothetical protein